MVLFEIDPQCPPVAPLEGDAPRAVHMDRIAPWPRTAQRVEIEAGLIERFEARRCVDCIETRACFCRSRTVPSNHGAKNSRSPLPDVKRRFICVKRCLTVNCADSGKRTVDSSCKLEKLAEFFEDPAAGIRVESRRAA
jgi:hypothetical protein